MNFFLTSLSYKELKSEAGFDVCVVYYQVKRVLKSGGKFICLTLAEAHVLGIFHHNFLWDKLGVSYCFGFTMYMFSYSYLFLLMKEAPLLKLSPLRFAFSQVPLWVDCESSRYTPEAIKKA